MRKKLTLVTVGLACASLAFGLSELALAKDLTPGAKNTKTKTGTAAKAAKTVRRDATDDQRTSSGKAAKKDDRGGSHKGRKGGGTGGTGGGTGGTGGTGGGTGGTGGTGGGTGGTGGTGGGTGGGTTTPPPTSNKAVCAACHSDGRSGTPPTSHTWIK